MKFTIRLTGSSALLMHNGRLSDPLDPAAKALKAITSKRKKTDEDQETVSYTEFAGGLYIDPDIGPYVPGDNIWRSLFDAAKKSRDGVRVKEGVLITSEVNPLVYPGPRDVEGLWADKNHVFRVSARTGMNRISRTRPIFPSWVVEAEGILDEGSLDPSDLVTIAERAGNLVGLGDWRPRFGRFVAEVKFA